MLRPKVDIVAGKVDQAIDYLTSECKSGPGGKTRYAPGEISAKFNLSYRQIAQFLRPKVLEKFNLSGGNLTIKK